MQVLNELMGIIDMERLKTEGLWAFLFERNSKMEQFCLALHAGAIKSDRDAMRILYGGGRPANKYYNLKARLEERLTLAATLIESKKKNFSNRQIAFFECNRKWASAMILIAKQSRIAAIGQLEALLKQTLHYEFTELSMSIASMLRTHFGTIADDQGKYERYNNIYEKNKTVWLLEGEVESYYNTLMRCYIGIRATPQELREEALRTAATVQPLLRSSDAFKVHLLGRLIELKAHEWDPKATLRLCEEAIAFFKQKPYDSRLPSQAFYYNLISACIQLRAFERGETAIEAFSSVTEEGSFNWLKLQEQYCQLALHTHNYETALKVLVATKKHLRGEWIPPHIKEIWKIYEYFIYFLVCIEKIQDKALIEEAVLRRSKILGETPTFSKDKRGMNIPILLIQILILIAQHDYSKAIDRIDSIAVYSGRYLKKDNDSFRSNCFIKMLLQLPKSEFNREAAKRSCQKLLAQLESVPLNTSHQSHEIEVIPYETLWHLTLEILASRRVKLRKRFSDM